MRQSIQQRFLASRFRGQLIALSTVGLTGLALAISLVSSGFLGWRLESLVLMYLGELSGQFAKDSAVVFLAGSDGAAREHVDRIAAFPGVRQAALFKADAKTWVMSGEAGHWPVAPPSSGSSDPSEGRAPATPSHEDRDFWYFIVPIRLGTHAASPTATWGETQLLGYVAVAWRKAPLVRWQGWLWVLNTSVAMALAMFMYGAVHVLLRRLTEPLDALMRAMRQLQAGETGVRAAIAGPAETREIGRAFNALLERLEHHQAILEAEVRSRTGELRTALDAALIAKRYKDAFVSTMTHEMRTPLQSIIGYVQSSARELKFVREDIDAETFANLSDYLQVALRCSKELRFRVDQVLELAALEAGKREVALAPVDLAGLLDQVVSMVRPLGERNRNRLDAIREGPSLVRMDEDKLRQIVRNLLENACKFTRDGTVLLTARNTPDRLVIEVLDSGIGIPQNQLDLIFEPFHQGDAGVARRYGGTGLGLAIIQNLCWVLGATVAVDSQPGVGSCFQVTIPLPVRSRLSVASAAREPPDSAAA